MPSLYLRTKELFLEAVRRPPTDRKAYLDISCGDDKELRVEVESLLAVYDDEPPSRGGNAPSGVLFEPGDVFARRYRMVTRLGQGGMGEVWRADDLVLGIPVALKLMHSTTAEARSLLLNEVRLARRITHPAVCRVFDIGEEAGQVFLSMELVEGEDLAALIQRVGRLPSEKVADIGRQLCGGLAAAHAHGTLHRDLKPANVLIDEHGLVRITDFGIAITRDERARHTGIGTPGYMAPEQRTSGGELSERTDIYALGVVLYELLTGRRTGGGTDPGAQRPQRPRPSTMVDGVDPHLESVVMQALALDPLDRPQSASAMAASLSAPAHRITSRFSFWIGAAATVAAAIGLVVAMASRRSGPTLTEHDTILLTDFANSTGEPLFDGTLKVALAVAMEQSPFIKVFPDERVRDALRLMNRSPDERITRPIAREIAQREQIDALLAGSIVSLGRNYVIAIEAISSKTGDVMAREQVEAAQKEQVLTALGQAAARLRKKLGESLASIQKFDVPLPRATTSSLEALHSYALAEDKLLAREGAEPHLKRAIELDPEFALAHAMLSGLYATSRRSTLAPEFSKRAFELRDRVSERERFFISWRYFRDAAQDWEEALDLARSWTETYPREPFALNSLGVALMSFGRFDQAVEPFRAAIRLDPTFVAALENLAAADLALNRLDDAKEVARQAAALRPDLVRVRRLSYLAAFIEGDSAAVTRELDAAHRLPDPIPVASWEARASAFRGRIQEADDRFRGAVRVAADADQNELAAEWSAQDAEAHALVGQCAEAQRDAAAAVGLSRDNFTLERSGRVLALCGAADEVAALSSELAERFSEATLTRRIQQPVIEAALAVRAGDATRALATLGPVTLYDHARGAEFWPAYLRGLAHLAAKNGAAAAAQFEDILKHRSENADSPLYPLAHLGLARASLQAGDTVTARRAYETFLTLWRDADPGLRPLSEARREYARLR